MREFGLLLVLGIEMKERKEEKSQRLGQILSFFSLLFVLRTARRQTLVKLLPERVAGGIIGLEVACWGRRSGVGGREGKKKNENKGKEETNRAGRRKGREEGGSCGDVSLVWNLSNARLGAKRGAERKNSPLRPRANDISLFSLLAASSRNKEKDQMIKLKASFSLLWFPPSSDHS